MSTFHPHFEILPSAQIQLWKELQPLKKLGFVLYGGTALALRLGHRVSVDFDLFLGILGLGALAHLNPQRMESCR